MTHAESGRTVLGVHLACVVALAMFLGGRMDSSVRELALAAIAVTAIAQTVVIARWMRLPEPAGGSSRTIRLCVTSIVAACWLIEVGFLAAEGDQALTGNLNRAAAAFFGLTILTFAAVVLTAGLTSVVAWLQGR
jgi:hypothetical protein